MQLCKQYHITYNKKRMKQFLSALTLVILFAGCKKGYTDPTSGLHIVPPKIKQIKTDHYSYDFIYDASSSKIDKIIVNYLYDVDHVKKSRLDATYTFEYDKENKVITANADRVVNQVLLVNMDEEYKFSYADGRIHSVETDPAYSIALNTLSIYDYDLSGNLIKAQNEDTSNEYRYINNVLTRSIHTAINGSISDEYEYKFSQYKNPTNSLDKAIAILINKNLYGPSSDPAISLQNNYLSSRDEVQYIVLEAKKNYPTKVLIKSQLNSQKFTSNLAFEYFDF